MGQYDCDQCGKPLMPTPSGSACPDGHGKLLPKLPPYAARINSAKLMGLPNAKSNGRGRYKIDGLEGLYEPRRTYTRVLHSAHLEDGPVAIDGGVLRVFERVDVRAADA